MGGDAFEADDLPPEIARLWGTPQDEWRIEQWREYSHWLERSKVGAAEELSMWRAHAIRALRAEVLLRKVLLILERRRIDIGQRPRARDSTANLGLAHALSLSMQVEIAQERLRRQLANPIDREAFVRLRSEKNPVVANWVGRLPGRKGEIAFKLKVKALGYAYPTKPPRRRGAPEKPDGLAARIVAAIERSNTLRTRSLRKIVRDLIDDRLMGHAEHVRNGEFKTLYQQVRDARKKAQRKLGKKSN